MSLKFIYGKSGTGKTIYCCNEIKKLINRFQNILKVIYYDFETKEILLKNLIY